LASEPPYQLNPDQNLTVVAPFILATNWHAHPFKILPSVADRPFRRTILNKPINENCLMGAFWNPNGGLIVDGRKLSKKEVAGLKRNWSDNRQLLTGFLKRWWANIKFVALALIS